MKFRAFNITLDIKSLPDAARTICDWAVASDRLRYVVTPNVDHVIQLERSPRFRSAYSGASLVLVDGWPVAKVVGLLSKRAVDTVPGSDLVPAVFDEFSRRGTTAKIFLLGALPGVADKAARVIAARWPRLRTVGTYSPPFGFENDADESAKICSMIRGASPDIIVLGLGAPKQELWVHRHQEMLGDGVAICAGATIDFLAGSKARAPHWVRRLRMEWLHRMLLEPSRLATRYLKGMVLFPLYSAREILKAASRKV